MPPSVFARIFGHYQPALSQVLGEDRQTAITYTDPGLDATAEDLGGLGVILGQVATEESDGEDGREWRHTREVSIPRAGTVFADRLPAIGGTLAIDTDTWAVDAILLADETWVRVRLVARRVAEMGRSGYRRK